MVTPVTSSGILVPALTAPGSPTSSLAPSLTFPLELLFIFSPSSSKLEQTIVCVLKTLTEKVPFVINEPSLRAFCVAGVAPGTNPAVSPEAGPGQHSWDVTASDSLLICDLGSFRPLQGGSLGHEVSMQKVFRESTLETRADTMGGEDTGLGRGRS